MTSNTATVREHARYGASSQQELDGPLPQPFPREIGPRAMEYLAEVVDSGLTCDMVGRFEQAFAEAHGVAHLPLRRNVLSERTRAARALHPLEHVLR